MLGNMHLPTLRDEHAMLSQGVIVHGTILSTWMDSTNWMEVILWACLALVGISFLRALMAYNRNSSRPIDWPVVRMLPGLLMNAQNLYEWLTILLIETGGNFQFWGPWFTNINYYVTADPRNVEHVLRLNFNNYPKGPNFTDIFRDLLGNGIFNADNELWQLQRKASSLQMKSRVCKEFTDETIIVSVNKKLLPILHHFCGTATPIDLQDLMLRFTFDTMCNVGFGMDVGCLSHDLPSIPFASAFEHALDCTMLRFFLPPTWWKTLKFLQIGKENGMPASIQAVNRFLDHIVLTRRRELQVDTCSNSKADLLSCFMRLEEYSLDDKFLKDMSINFLLAGRDTSALALSWFFWLVATHPHVEEKIIEEMNQVFGSSNKPSLSRDVLHRLTYLHAALSEALRLYPSLPVDVKHIMEDDVLPDGNHIKKGHRFTYSTYSMGRMQSIWGSDCTSFRPERWLSEDGTSCRQDISPFQYPAFNAGPRTCLGKDMAYFIMKAVASMLLLHFKVKLVPGHKVVPKISVTLYMKHGLLVTLEPRETTLRA